jgi:hypothetical protein
LRCSLYERMVSQQSLKRASMNSPLLSTNSTGKRRLLSDATAMAMRSSTYREK